MKSEYGDCRLPFISGDHERGHFYSLPALQARLGQDLTRLPRSLRVILESVMRRCAQDHSLLDAGHLERLANWRPRTPRNDEIPFFVSRVLAPDASGIPLLADLAATREKAIELGYSGDVVEPEVIVDLIVDHSIQVDVSGRADALRRNMQLEFDRNHERYAFIKWAASTFRSLRVIPPGMGILHQINIEYLARGVWEREGVFHPDSVVGPDSHTCMINGIGVLGWGVGGIEAESVMLGKPMFLPTPDVVGVELRGFLGPGVSATDLVLTVTRMLRAAKVVGKFVEFYGEGAARLSGPDRCTVANMAPEYGATCAYFPVDGETLAFLRSMGRTEDELDLLRSYFEQQMFGMPLVGEIDYSENMVIELDRIRPCVAGPSRPQDSLPLDELASSMAALVASRGAGAVPTVAQAAALRDGDIVIAAITSCSNTSNPRLLLMAGLLARNAAARGLRVPAHVKTSMTPGSRVVESYLRKTGLQPALDALGFHIVGYGCGTCMGNSGPLPAAIADEIEQRDLTVAAVLSGNRNFEARIHPLVRANYLMSPALVVALAIAGRADIDVSREPLAIASDGQPVHLHDIWPSDAEVDRILPCAQDPANFTAVYANTARSEGLWEALESVKGSAYPWSMDSTYLRRPPYFDDFLLVPAERAPIRDARALAILSDSVTTDHISPGGAISPQSPAGAFLMARGVQPADFNTYVARRANHEVMVRGAFDNPRLRNTMVQVEGGLTMHQPSGRCLPIYDAAMAYRQEGVPLVIVAGAEYGTGSSRDWAAKGPKLLGVRAVIAASFERIHRSNLIGMGILPCQFPEGESAKTLGLDGSETYTLHGVESWLQPGQFIRASIRRRDGTQHQLELLVRLDTWPEVRQYENDGLLPSVLRELLKRASHASRSQPARA
jgi:aconitate hydratase